MQTEAQRRDKALAIRYLALRHAEETALFPVGMSRVPLLGFIRANMQSVLRFRHRMDTLRHEPESDWLRFGWIEHADGTARWGRKGH